MSRRDEFVVDPMLLWDGQIARQNIVDAGLVSPDYRVYRARDGAVPAFLGYLFRSTSMRTLYKATARGTNVRRSRISRSDFLHLPASVPTVEEQQRIAVVLSALDATVERTRAVIEQLDRLRKAVMHDLLTRGMPGKQTAFQSTAVGEIPRAWSVLPIGEVIERCDYGISSALSTQRAGVAVLRMGNLRDGRVVLDDLKYTERSVLDGKDLLLEPGDVLFNRTNSADLVGKVGVFEGANEQVTFASYLLRLRTKSNALGRWLAYVMNTDQNQRRLRDLATVGVSQVNINRAQMLALLVPVPPMEEQGRIVDALRVLDLRAQTERHYLVGAEEVRADLTSALLTGAVRLARAEVAE